MDLGEGGGGGVGGGAALLGGAGAVIFRSLGSHGAAPCPHKMRGAP
jgi:hypothetical protein